MVVHAPFHPDAALPKKTDPAEHELLEEVTQDDGASGKQRMIGWICFFLTAAAVAVVWFLL